LRVAPFAGIDDLDGSLRKPKRLVRIGSFRGSADANPVLTQKGSHMATYVLMTKLGPATLEDARGRRAAGQEWKRAVEKACPGLKWIAHFALLGPYDFMDVYEAPDQETAFRVSLLSREFGAQSAESWPAVAYESLLTIADEVEKVRKK